MLSDCQFPPIEVSRSGDPTYDHNLVKIFKDLSYFINIVPYKDIKLYNNENIDSFLQ